MDNQIIQFKTRQDFMNQGWDNIQRKLVKSKQIKVIEMWNNDNIPIIINDVCNHAGSDIDTISVGGGEDVEEREAFVCKCGAYALVEYEESEDGIDKYMEDWLYE